MSDLRPHDLMRSQLSSGVSATTPHLELMASYSTSDEVLAEQIAALGRSAGTIYNEVWNELGLIHLKWSQFAELFAKGEVRIDLMNRSAPTFFRVISDIMWEDLLLHMARLTDPVGSGSRRNLSVRALQESLSDDQLRDRIEPLIQGAELKCGFARDWRNRHIAHRDFDLAVREGARPLEAAGLQSVREGLAALAAVFQAIQRSVFGSDIRFEPFLHSGGAVDLLYVIYEGVEADKAKQTRLRTGRALPGDMDLPPSL